jgi:phosphomethylpyrimidine synthase
MQLRANFLESAKLGREDKAVELVARAEGVGDSFLRRKIAAGRVVIMHSFRGPPVGIGEGLRTKVNANIGTSTEVFDAASEIEKARTAEKYGADTITDLSMGGPLEEIRRRILEKTTVPLTTVPIYQAVAEKGAFKEVAEGDLMRIIGEHVREGISSLVLHAGITLEMLDKLKRAKRIMGMVSKGGSFTSAWMWQNDKENPFLSRFDEICGILRQKDVVLSLGNAMRSGCIHDSMDDPQKMEAELNAALARRANELGVQVIIEGMGGHISPSKILDYVAYYKKTTDNRPLFVAGPLPIDIGVGYDHVAGCVGGSLAAGAGADYICCITPSEHLALPTALQVREGVVAFKIAAHIGDSIKYGPRAQDRKLAECRWAKDWEGQFRMAIDGERAREIHGQDGSGRCSMCGKYCAIDLMRSYLR